MRSLCCFYVALIIASVYLIVFLFVFVSLPTVVYATSRKVAGSLDFLIDLILPAALWP
jgi:hypothetical protein